MLPIQVSKLDDLKKSGLSRIVVAIGVFDGIHLGHRKIIEELLEMSEELAATPVLITFFPHPRKILYPEKPLQFLRSPDQKAEILGELGIKAIVTVPFCLEFANLEPNEFIEEFMHPHRVKLAGICVGKKWRFGARAKGDEKTLHDFADKYGFVFNSVEEVYCEGKIVSSTAIRKVLAEGDFASANQMLNAKYNISGHVINLENNKIAKVQIDYGVLPPPGFYLVYLNNNRRVKATIQVLSDSELAISSATGPLPEKEMKIEFIADAYSF